MKRAVPTIDTVELGIVSTQVCETPNKIFIGGIPREWDEDKIKELLVRSAGKLKSFHLVRDNKDQQSKGYAFCEMATLEGVQLALQNLNGMQIIDSGVGGSKTLNVRRTGQFANQSIEAQIQNASQPFNQSSTFPPSTFLSQTPTGALDSHFKAIYEDNITELVKNMGAYTQNMHEIETVLKDQEFIKTMRQRLDSNNLAVKQFLKETYQYELCTPYIKMTI